LTDKVKGAAEKAVGIVEGKPGKKVGFQQVLSASCERSAKLATPGRAQ